MKTINETRERILRVERHKSGGMEAEIVVFQPAGKIVHCYLRFNPEEAKALQNWFKDEQHKDLNCSIFMPATAYAIKPKDAEA